MEIQLRTLTPLWTGGVETGKMDRLHESGLIGSLRWWYEALVRGLGGSACDPTSEDRCEYDPRKAAPPEKQLCAACYLFGCTGWGRKFRVVVSERDGLFNLQEGQGQNVLLPSGRVHKTKKGDRAGGWFLFADSRIGALSLQIQSVREMTSEELNLLKVTVALIARWGTFVAKASSGYGVIDGPIDFSLDNMPHFSQNLPPRNSELPDLRDFFFTKFQFQEPSDNPLWWKSIFGIRQAVNGKLDDGSSPPPLRNSVKELGIVFEKGILPIAPAIRNWLRYTWQHGLSPAETHFVFGEAQAVCPHCGSG